MSAGTLLPLFQQRRSASGTWKTSLGLSAASIKTVDGLAKPSIKTNLGLTP